MEPMSIALIYAAALGGVLLLAAFVRQILLSRDKRLNDMAQRRALSHEVNMLEKMRFQMENKQRFDSHYQVLGANKEAIRCIDLKIEEILRKKAELIDQYAKATVKESGSILNGEVSPKRKAACDQLRTEIDKEIEFYDSELKQLQERRHVLWDAHTDFQKYLLNQEKSRNDNLDGIYKLHSSLLEKVYLRHIDDSEIIAIKGIEAANLSFKDMIMAPLQFLMQYFGVSPGVSFIHTRIENGARIQVEQAEREINESNQKMQEKEELESPNLKKQQKEVMDQPKQYESNSEYEKEPSPEEKTNSFTCV